MLDGTVLTIGADSSDGGQNAAGAAKDGVSQVQPLTYKALVALNTQTLKSPSGELLKLTPGMRVTAEINQGRRTVMEYLLSPVQKVANEAGRER